MKNTLKNVFHSPRFLVGFIIFMVMLLTVLIYPYFVTRDPLQALGKGFLAPAPMCPCMTPTTPAPTAWSCRKRPPTVWRAPCPWKDRQMMLDFLKAKGVDVTGLDTSNDRFEDLIAAWKANYDEADAKKNKYEGFATQAQRNALKRLDRTSERIPPRHDRDQGRGRQRICSRGRIRDYVKVDEVANAITLPLGTDNFGRDTLTELVKATGISLIIGLIAGSIATLLGLIVGLLAGYMGGMVDDVLMFIANIFTVIPGFVLLILIYYSVGQAARGITTCALVIGFTSWVWTARSVRSQVISLRNRDHVNLSKLSGHSLFRIIVTDILPYIASYVVMAFILQVSSGILAEAQLSLLGLGPKTTDVPTLGLMMNWAKLFGAYTSSNAWWAYFPVILVIALISFSLNLMNTGLDQVFNPTLRD